MTEIPRDRWGRPLIIPPEGGEPVPYARPSGFGKCLDDMNGLMAWQQRKVIEGVLRRPDLLTRVSGILANGNPDTDAGAKRDLNRACAEAREAAGASKGASAGTGFHSLTEAVDRGEWPEFVSDADSERLKAYQAATQAAGLVPLDAETFVANDTVRAAGTFDRLWRCPDGKVRVGDLKTGKSEADYPRNTTIQVAIYARGARYDPETGGRTVLHPDLDRDVGLLIHLPPSGGCAVYRLNLRRGWDAALVAAQVRALQSVKAAALVREVARA